MSQSIKPNVATIRIATNREVTRISRTEPSILRKEDVITIRNIFWTEKAVRPAAVRILQNDLLDFFASYLVIEHI